MATGVLQVVTSTERRGAELFAVDLGDELAARGYSIETVALAPGHASSLAVPALGPSRLSRRTLAALRARARTAGLVIAHGSTTLPASVVATVGLRVPLVYRNIGDPAFWGRTRVRQLQSILLLRRARLVVALTDRTATQLVARYRVPPERVRAIPKGIPAEQFPPVDAPRRQAARARLGLRLDAPVILYLGALSPEKQVDRAIDALVSLPGVELMVVGDGPERPALERRATERVSGRVQFRGPTSDPAEALAAADAVVLPSRTEGLPGVLIEAGLSGLPVVASDVGFVREIVVDGETGFLVPPNDTDALGRALDRALRAGPALGVAARAHCQARFALDVVATAWQRVIDEVLSVPRVDSSRVE